MRKFQVNIFRLLLIAIVGLLPEIGFSLGLGQIKLYSYLNEPVDAEIELLNAEDVDTSHVIVSLASAQDFKKADLARPYILTKLRFQVAQQGKKLFIRMTSDEPIKQPFLEFLVVVSWSEGRLVRGYTLLLDPAPLGSADKRAARSTHSELPMGDKDAVQKMQDKLARNYQLMKANGIQPNENALSDKSVTLTSEKARQEGNEVVATLENLFDPETDQDLKKESFTSSIQKSIPVSIEDQSANAQSLLVTDQEIFTEDANEKESISPSWFAMLSTKFTKSKLINGLNNNKLLLGSGLALIFAVSLTTWFLRRARSTVPVSAEHVLQPVEIFDPEIVIKLELARQYIEVEDPHSAQEILHDIISRGNNKERETARELLTKTIPH